MVCFAALGDLLDDESNARSADICHFKLVRHIHNFYQEWRRQLVTFIFMPLPLHWARDGSIHLAYGFLVGGGQYSMREILHKSDKRHALTKSNM